jgi:hypothetical protein
MADKSKLGTTSNKKNTKSSSGNNSAGANGC